MSSRRYASYARDRLDDGSAILEWADDQYRYWAFSYDGTRYLVKARIARDEVVDVRRPRRLGGPQLTAVLRDHWIEIRDPDDEVPAPVALMARRGPGVVKGVDAPEA